MWQKVAFALIGIGAVVIIYYGVKGFFLSADVPLAVRIAIGIIVFGILVLLGIAIKDRRKKAKTEDFKEIEK
jgi:xanthine/uracil permease